jgi:hypothetical protein
MARNPRRNDNNIVNHPAIEDIELLRRETLINFKSQPKPKVFKRKESEQVKSNPDQPQENDEAEGSGEKL